MPQDDIRPVPIRPKSAKYARQEPLDMTDIEEMDRPETHSKYSRRMPRRRDDDSDDESENYPKYSRRASRQRDEEEEEQPQQGKKAPASSWSDTISQNRFTVVIIILVVALIVILAHFLSKKDDKSQGIGGLFRGNPSQEEQIARAQVEAQTARQELAQRQEALTRRQEEISRKQEALAQQNACTPGSNCETTQTTNQSATEAAPPPKEAPKGSTPKLSAEQLRQLQANSAKNSKTKSNSVTHNEEEISNLMNDNATTITAGGE